MIRATISAKEFSDILGVSLWTLYQSVREGTCPIEPIRIGRRMVWGSSQVAALLGVQSIECLMLDMTSGDGDGIAGPQAVQS